jgi:hypothetical protein
MFTVLHKAGLLLEDRGILLPWGAGLNEIAMLGFSSVQEWPSESLFTWEDALFLGGLAGKVQARSERDRPLREFMLRLRPSEEPPKQVFKQVRIRLEEMFGPPVREWVSGHAGALFEEFRDLPLKITHWISERHGDEHVLQIRHTEKIERNQHRT